MNATEQATHTSAPNLEAYRSNNEDRAPTFTERTEPLAPPPERSTDHNPVVATEKEDLVTPPLRRDPRLDIARRNDQRRAEIEMDTERLPIESASIPDGVRFEGQDEDEPVVERQPERRPQEEAPKAAYHLRVNHNDFTVSRDELLRYAQLEPGEDEGISDVTLVRIAQKNLAADLRLDEVKQAEQRLRAARNSSSHQDDLDTLQPVRQSHQAQPTGTPAEDEADLIDKIQLGDKGEALDSLRKVISSVVDGRTKQNAIHTGDRQFAEAVEQFAPKAKEIFEDAVLTDLYASTTKREMLDELASIGVSDAELAMVRNNEALLQKAYAGAVGQGFKVRTPAKLLDDALAKVQQKIGRQQPSEAEPPAAQSRIEAKRGLVQQPARSDNQVSPAAQQPKRGSQVLRDPNGPYARRFNRG